MSTDSLYDLNETTEPGGELQTSDIGYEHEVDTDTDGVNETEAAEAGDAPADRRPKRQNPRPMIRRAVRKTIEVIEADRQVAETAAELLGVDSGNTEAFVTAILTADRRSHLQPVTDIRRIRESDLFEMGIVTTALGRERMREIWKLLGHFSLVEGAMPASEPKAALKIASAVNDLDAAVLEVFDNVDELLKRA